MGQGKWLDISDYAKYRGKSVSTIRRYIKSKNIQYKIVSGKYYIFAVHYEEHSNLEHDKQILKLKIENQELKKKLKIAYEQAEEMKMLVQMLERNKNENNNYY